MSRVDESFVSTLPGSGPSTLRPASELKTRRTGSCPVFQGPELLTTTNPAIVDPTAAPWLARPGSLVTTAPTGPDKLGGRTDPSAPLNRTTSSPQPALLPGAEPATEDPRLKEGWVVGAVRWHLLSDGLPV